MRSQKIDAGGDEKQGILFTWPYPIIVILLPSWPSSHASSELVSAILPSHLNSLPLPFIDEAAACWSQSHDSEPPVGTGACKQKSWDAPRASATVKHLLVNAKDDEDCAQLLAASTKESGAWLRALPVSGLGLRLDDASVRIAVGLRLGTPICGQHLCQHCGASVHGCLGKTCTMLPT